MADTPKEREEAARVRRRLLNIGEIVAILAVVISALTFWNSWRERANTEAEHAAADAQSQKKAGTLLLKAAPERDGRVLVLTARDEAQAIQSQTIHFPTALKLSPAETSGDARVERGWFDDAVKDARSAAEVKDAPGDARLPVLIETRFVTDGEPHSDIGLYQIGYATKHDLFGATSLMLRGLSRVGPVASVAAGQKRVDTLWTAQLKRK